MSRNSKTPLGTTRRKSVKKISNTIIFYNPALNKDYQRLLASFKAIGSATAPWTIAKNKSDGGAA
ncbi:hypothetical protein [Scytonema sp. PCC 10023]|uniref:hypothetical protein n=1 Tax=Scytonema sp. PCC 10023 TaxID=1680591 RepID=UPI0039C6AD5B